MLLWLPLGYTIWISNYTPRFNEVDRGVYWYHLVRLSVCGQNRVRSVSSRILIGSISYLHILSSNFRRCVACNARLKIQKFDFVFFWLGIQYDSMVWVIMRRRGVSSECRRSSCSSFSLMALLLDSCLTKVHPIIIVVWVEMYFVDDYLSVYWYPGFMLLSVFMSILFVFIVESSQCSLCEVTVMVTYVTIMAALAHNNHAQTA